MFGIHLVIVLTYLICSCSRGVDGATYTRWGRKVCSETASVLYSGYMAGPHYKQQGAGSDFLCLPQTPQWNYYEEGNQACAGYIYGTETENYGNSYGTTCLNPFSTINNGGRSTVNQPVPCAVCNVARRYDLVMIPAATECPAGWTLEYSGYIVSEGVKSDRQRSSYLCFDGAPEAATGGFNQDQAVLYAVQVGCGSLPCDVYKDGRELACVVCTY